MLPDSLVTLFVFLFGAIIGSFLNVYILRFNTGRSLGGRSSCMSCLKKLEWYELIPVLSFLYQGGRCSACRVRISPQYLIVEVLSGFAAYYSVFLMGFTVNAALVFVMLLLLLAISVYDIRHTIIPDEWVYSFSLLALYSNLCIPSGCHEIGLAVQSANFLIGPILFTFFAALWASSKGRWMGLGDAKLALGLGWLLGFPLAFSGILLAFWAGALWGIVLLFTRKRLFTMKSEIPFAPFLIFGALLALITGWTPIPWF